VLHARKELFVKYVKYVKIYRSKNNFGSSK